MYTTQTAGNQKLATESLSWIKRALFIFLAWSCIGLGILGIFIPGLPTVDFIVLASYFAAKGSKRLHHWLNTNRFFGKYIKAWGDGRCVPRKAKYFSTLSMSLASIILFIHHPHSILFYGATACMAIVLSWLWSRPESRQVSNTS